MNTTSFASTYILRIRLNFFEGPKERRKRKNALLLLHIKSTKQTTNYTLEWVEKKRKNNEASERYNGLRIR